MGQPGPAAGRAADPAAHPPDGSRLCLACGLCCRGALHTNVLLLPEEQGPARELGLRPESYPDHLGFRLPCVHYKERRCAIYPARPAACRRYRCALLEACLEGSLPLEQAERTARRAAGLFDRLEQRLPPGGVLWTLHSDQGGEAVELPRQVFRQWLFAAADLEYFLRRHFLPRR